MLYRRFGRTELPMPVITCGGMRYQQSWTAGEPATPENQKNLEATIRRAVDAGVYHIETARGYGTSEEQLGRVLPGLARDRLIVQTKVAPKADPDAFEAEFIDSMKRLKLDYVDLLGLHGLNADEPLDWALRDGGCLERAQRFVERGLVRHIGFSTHGSTELLLRAVADGRFAYINLHYYFVFQLHHPVIEAATRQDMGVFIISPNDKGGKLYEPSAKLRQLTSPLLPMAFNDLWCLGDERIHTLSTGAARPSDFDVHLDAVARLGQEGSSALVAEVAQRLRAAVDADFGPGWFETWHQGLPEHERVPGGINVLEIVRLYTWARALDLLSYARMRYNLLGSGGHWFPGKNLERLEQYDLRDCLAQSPHRDQVLEILRLAHPLLAGEKRQRMQQS